MHPLFRLALANACLGAALALPARAQEAQPTPAPDEPPQATAPAEKAKKPDLEIATAPAKEAHVVTHHSVTVDGKPLAYTATAGTLTLRNDLGKPTASMFYVAYVAEGGDGAKRPVTFFYNGGPGSASLWLHMGSLGPVHVLTDSPGATHGAPFKVEPNAETLLPKTDMVFLDAIGTGYSRALEDTKEEKFWGVDPDIEAFTKAITRYLTINDRWNSPKYLFGESYGTTRSAGLSLALQHENIQFNGIILLSSILNYGIHIAGFDQEYVAYLPSYAAAAWYHGKANPKPADLAAFLAEVRAYAGGPYLLALEKGQNLPADEADEVAQRLSAYTGLSVPFLKECHLRVSLGRFRKELLRDQHRTIGRYDSRFLAIDADDAGETPEIDPSSDYIGGAFVAALHDVLSTQLNYHSDLEYRVHGIETNEKWDAHHKQPGATRPSPVADVALDLAAAMRSNPHLRVLSLNGWYDMATPFFQTEYDLAHMFLDPSLRSHVQFAYYPSGHMVYLNPDALKQMRADVDRFYDAGSP
jgi:carboxypeptidase C (cathepsin A)